MGRLGAAVRANVVADFAEVFEARACPDPDPVERTPKTPIPARRITAVPAAVPAKSQGWRRMRLRICFMRSGPDVCSRGRPTGEPVAAQGSRYPYRQVSRILKRVIGARQESDKHGEIRRQREGPFSRLRGVSSLPVQEFRDLGLDVFLARNEDVLAVIGAVRFGQQAGRSRAAHLRGEEHLHQGQAAHVGLHHTGRVP